MNDPRISGKEEKWEFQGFEISAVFSHKGTPGHGYIYVYQLHARIDDKHYGGVYGHDKFTFEQARKHFEGILKEHVS